jgi:hypothetical protein
MSEPTRVDELHELIAVLDFPEGDIRLRFAALALEIAEALDEGTVDDPGIRFRTRSPEWMFGYVLEDLTMFPNDPPTFLNEIRYRVARNWWDSRPATQRGT